MIIKCKAFLRLVLMSKPKGTLLGAVRNIIQNLLCINIFFLYCITPIIHTPHWKPHTHTTEKLPHTQMKSSHENYWKAFPHPSKVCPHTHLECSHSFVKTFYINRKSVTVTIKKITAWKHFSMVYERRIEWLGHAQSYIRRRHSCAAWGSANRCTVETRSCGITFHILTLLYGLCDYQPFAYVVDCLHCVKHYILNQFENVLNVASITS